MLAFVARNKADFVGVGDLVDSASFGDIKAPESMIARLLSAPTSALTSRAPTALFPATAPFSPKMMDDEDDMDSGDDWDDFDEDEDDFDDGDYTQYDDDDYYSPESEYEE
ncbi:hypothetical protein BKN38_01180 [Helicobacter sp. CLO-3]|uniref:hypothetical protein n=1 Tax=unclassified Helicobacter TaxID=2593540 RepID=UPI000804D340|nr:MULTISPECIES: hypothetical protein [unclassified Helicobacter]OBV28557.1 hypothetical protein BA723_09015 [Helicobacter sp. CLO-3]OHU85657.1 hypothetical protein BKN38_01180 [Helicobacter sp. CLO-3]